MGLRAMALPSYNSSRVPGTQQMLRNLSVTSVSNVLALRCFLATPTSDFILPYTLRVTDCVACRDLQSPFSRCHLDPSRQLSVMDPYFHFRRNKPRRGQAIFPEVVKSVFELRSQHLSQPCSLPNMCIIHYTEHCHLCRSRF